MDVAGLSAPVATPVEIVMLDGQSANDGAAAFADPPRRVLFVDHTAVLGGGEIALLNLVRHLDRSRYVPVVLLFSAGKLAERMAEAGVETHLLPLASTVINTRKDSLRGGGLLRVRTVARTLAFTIRVARLIRKLNVDLVHTNSLKADVIGGLAARLAGKKVVWHIRDRIAEDYLPKAAVKAMRFLVRRVPHYVIANSQCTLQTLNAAGALPSASIPSGLELGAEQRQRVVHDGLDTQDFTAEEPRAGGALRIGIVGRLAHWKGQHVFLDAAARVRELFPAVRFQIIGAALFGEEAYEKDLRAQAMTLGLDGAVEFTGFRDDVPQLIEGLDILVHASIMPEPFGQVVVEGMAAHTPVVATDGGGPREIVVQGETGLLVPMGDAAAMAGALLLLLEDPALRRRMGEAGARRVAEKFTIERTAARVQEVYDQMLLTPERGEQHQRAIARF